MNQNLEEIVEVFSMVTKEASNQAIPKLSYSKTKSYPGHIIELIKMRIEVRKLKKRECPEEKVQLNMEFYRLTSVIKLNIIKHTREKWKVFLNKLCPYQASSSVFWKIINRAKSPISS